MTSTTVVYTSPLTTKVFGSPDEIQFGHTSFGIYFDSKVQSDFMQELLHTAMVKYAGQPEETLLAKWNNEISFQVRKAQSYNWAGWEK